MVVTGIVIVIGRMTRVIGRVMLMMMKRVIEGGDSDGDS